MVEQLDDVTIRPAAESDAAGIAPVHVRSWQEAYAGHRSRGVPRLHGRDRARRPVGLVPARGPLRPGPHVGGTGRRTGGRVRRPSARAATRTPAAATGRSTRSTSTRARWGHGVARDLMRTRDRAPSATRRPSPCGCSRTTSGPALLPSARLPGGRRGPVRRRRRREPARGPLPPRLTRPESAAQRRPAHSVRCAPPKWSQPDRPRVLRPVDAHRRGTLRTRPTARNGAGSTRPAGTSPADRDPPPVEHPAARRRAEQHRGSTRAGRRPRRTAAGSSRSSRPRSRARSGLRRATSPSDTSIIAVAPATAAAGPASRVDTGAGGRPERVVRSARAASSSARPGRRPAPRRPRARPRHPAGRRSAARAPEPSGPRAR